ncbi:MAG: hypothetical protein KC464_22995, partial [Myxococcales bacterium]|nr:hypothetical protein [Myxococcales bacterium]
EARKAAAEADRVAAAAAATSKDLDEKADAYASAETGDVNILISAANTSIASGKLSEAKRDLDKAAKQIEESGEKVPAIKYSYARLYDAMAKRAKSPEERIGLLEKAQQQYDAFAATGAGAKVARARERSDEITEEIAELQGGAP